MKCTMVIFGASGDLTKRKLIPALLTLYIQNRLHPDFTVLGTGRTAFDDMSFRKYVKRIVNGLIKFDQLRNNFILEDFLMIFFYQTMDTFNLDHYTILANRLAGMSNSSLLFYLSTPPNLFEPVLAGLNHCGLNREAEGWRRIIIEKPFGTDYNSARHLNLKLKNSFDEKQIFRIDHYLGKETVQNMLVFRFANGIFEPLWNRNFIDRIEITAAESLGVGNRAGYYDNAGAVRDMIQNHLLQVLGFVGMEPPVSFESDSIRDETTKVLSALRPLIEDRISEHVVRGQYTESRIDQETSRGYRHEPGVDLVSRTETYAAMKVFIDNWRWAGVPFYIRTGKKLPVRVTEVVIYFKRSPHNIFKQSGESGSNGNVLVIRIQPDEGVLLKVQMKIPGSGFQLAEQNLHFKYGDHDPEVLPEAYERLILDALSGDQTLFARSDSVEKCWEFIDPLLKYWENHPDEPLYGYPAGTWGPLEAQRLFENEETDWRYPCNNLVDSGGYCEL